MRTAGMGVREPAAPATIDTPNAAREAAPTGDADPFGLDLEFRSLVMPAFRFLHDRYWRVELSGAHHLPATGPVVVVANHSGALPFDGAMIVTAVDALRGRVLRFLYDRFVEAVSPLDAFYRAVGGVIASRDNARALLDRGDALLVFPEGISGVAKPFSERYRLRPFSPGFARLAIQCGAPVLPVAVVGAEEIYPLVGRAEGISQGLGIPYIPITPFFPLLGPLGALPLPTKWYMGFGRPFHLQTGTGDAEGAYLQARDEALRVRRRLQAMVTRLKNRRRSVFFG